LILAFTSCGGTCALHGQAIATADASSTKPLGYPLAAKATGIEGTVVVKGILGKDGKMRDIRAVKGPIELRQAAVDVVSRYPYKPLTDHAGTPRKVKVKVKVVYSMGNKKEKAAAQAAAQEALTKEAAKSTVEISSPGPAIKN